MINEYAKEQNELLESYLKTNVFSHWNNVDSSIGLNLISSYNNCLTEGGEFNTKDAPDLDKMKAFFEWVVEKNYFIPWVKISVASPEDIALVELLLNYSIIFDKIYMYVDSDYLFDSIDNAISIATLLKNVGEHSKYCQPYFMTGKNFDMSEALAVSSIIDCTWVYTISPDNVSNVNDFYKEWLTTFSSDTNLLFIYTTSGWTDDNSKELLTFILNQAKFHLDSTKNIAEELFKKRSIYQIASTKGCENAYSLNIDTHNLSIVVCGGVKQYDRLSIGSFVIKDGKIVSILENNLYGAILLYTSPDPKHKLKCDMCSFNTHCKGGCFTNNLNETKDLSVQHDEYCNIEKAKLIALTRLLNMIPSLEDTLIDFMDNPEYKDEIISYLGFAHRIGGM